MAAKNEEPVRLSAKEFSLINSDVMSLKGFLLHFINAKLAPPTPPGAAPAASPASVISSVGGPANGLKDGTILYRLWERISEKPLEYDKRPGNEMAEKANLWGILAVLEEAGVQPIIPGHSWDAESIHSGDVVACIELLCAIAHFKGVRLPFDISYWEDGPEGSEPVKHPLTPTQRAEPRSAPLLLCKVVTEGRSKGQNLIIRRDPTVLGRIDEEGEVHIDDDTVSAMHCRVTYDGHNFVIRDIGSTHGTLLAQPWTRDFESLGDREHPLGLERVLWRGSEISLGDTQLIVVHIEGTDLYSDYPLLGGMFGLNLDITQGPPFQGQTTIGIHYPGSTFGSAVSAGPTYSGLGLAHGRIADLAPHHATFFFCNFYGRYLLSNNGSGETKLLPARNPAAGWLKLPKGSFVFVENGDQVTIGHMIFKATVIPPAAPVRR